MSSLKGAILSRALCFVLLLPRGLVHLLFPSWKLSSSFLLSSPIYLCAKGLISQGTQIHQALPNLCQHYFTAQDCKVKLECTVPTSPPGRLTQTGGAGHWQRGDGKGGVTIWHRAWGASRDTMLPLLPVEKITSNNIPLIQSTVDGFLFLWKYRKDVMLAFNEK